MAAVWETAKGRNPGSNHQITPQILHDHHLQDMMSHLSLCLPYFIPFICWTLIHQLLVLLQVHPSIKSLFHQCHFPVCLYVMCIHNLCFISGHLYHSYMTFTFISYIPCLLETMNCSLFHLVFPRKHVSIYMWPVVPEPRAFIAYLLKEKNHVNPCNGPALEM